MAYSAGKASLAWKPILVACVWIFASSLVLAMPVPLLRRGGRLVVMVPAALLATDLAANNGLERIDRACRRRASRCFSRTAATRRSAS